MSVRCDLLVRGASEVVTMVPGAGQAAPAGPGASGRPRRDPARRRRRAGRPRRLGRPGDRDRLRPRGPRRRARRRRRGRRRGARLRRRPHAPGVGGRAGGRVRRPPRRRHLPGDPGGRRRHQQHGARDAGGDGGAARRPGRAPPRLLLAARHHDPRGQDRLRAHPRGRAKAAAPPPRSRIRCAVVHTVLAAHLTPEEFAGRDDEYIALVCDEILPALAGQAEFVDVFCDEGAFTVAQARRVLEAGRALGYRLKIHAEELAHTGGTALAAALGAVSADHLIHITARTSRRSRSRAQSPSCCRARATRCTPRTRRRRSCWPPASRSRWPPTSTPAAATARTCRWPSRWPARRTG